MRNLMSDNRGVGPVIWVILVLSVVAIVGVFTWVGIQSGAGGTTQLQVTQNCAEAPYLDITVRNASIQSETSGASAYQYIVDVSGAGSEVSGKASVLTAGVSGTDFNLGDEGRILVTEASHLDRVVPFQIKNCASNKINVDFWRSDGGNMTVKDGGTTLSDHALGGANNLSSITAGSTKTVQIEIQSLGHQSIDPTYINVEIFNRTAVNDLRMSSSTSGVVVEEYKDSIPKGLTSSNATTTNYDEMFKVSGLPTKGVLAVLSLTIEASSSYAIDFTSVYVDGFSGEDAVDDDGTFILGAFEDDSGDVQYEDQYTDYDFHIT